MTYDELNKLLENKSGSLTAEQIKKIGQLLLV
jgi:hypothetical protein